MECITSNLKLDPLSAPWFQWLRKEARGFGFFDPDHKVAAAIAEVRSNLKKKGSKVKDEHGSPKKAAAPKRKNKSKGGKSKKARQE